MSATASVAGRAAAMRGGGSLPTRQRRPGLAALAVTLIVALGTLNGYLFTTMDSKTPMVVVVAKVPARHVITRADVSTAEFSGPVTAIKGRDIDSVVGQRASVTLLPDTPLQRSMLLESGQGALAQGQAQVGVAVKSGQVPADGLGVGDTVRVLQVPGTGSASADDSVGPAQVLVPDAVVWSTQPDPAQSGGTLLTLTVPDDAVAQVVSASGAGQIAVAKVAD